MPMAEYETTTEEVRRFAGLQIGLAVVFLLLLFFALGGLSEDAPPIWLIAVMLLAVGVSVFFAERVWMSCEPLDPDQPEDVLTRRAVGIYAGQVVRKVVILEIPIVLAVLVAFVGPYGGWPILVAGVPGVAAIAFETWPSLRNTSMTEAMLNADGAESNLIRSFRRW